MPLQTGHLHAVEAENTSQSQGAKQKSYFAVGQQPVQTDISRYLDIIQDSLKEGWSAHSTKDGRLYYCNHVTRTAGWLPPSENWGHSIEFPYGWEKAIDHMGRPYYINHLNKFTTYDAPEIYHYEEKQPEPRLVVLTRCQKMGFGFVAGSERPVIVRFVTEGGPSVNKLEPGDRILAVNQEDVKEAPRDHVIQLVRSCESQVSLLVCQPLMNGCAGRKSTLLSAGKKKKLRSRPNRVRFAESVCVNGAPLFPPSAFSLGDLCVPPMANVLKVYLENGQTKSFKYDNVTTVQDVVASLRDKLYLSADEHFSLVLEHVKSLKRNKLTLLDPQETLARIAARPGAHKLRCLFRVTFVPVSAALLAQKDLNSLDYLYMQSCNDVTQERFSPELQPEVALRLAALHIHQHSLDNNISPAKLNVKTVEREFGLERFVPSSLIDGMKRKELRRLMAHFLKLNSQMTGSSKMLTQLQAKIHYLDIISSLPSYGAKCFSTNQRDGVERVLLVSPRFGLSQIAGIRNSVPHPICSIEQLSRVAITREDDVTHSISVYLQPEKFVTFSMEDRDGCEFSLVLAGYHRLLTGKELLVEREQIEYHEEQNAPSYVSQHTVVPATWNYIATSHGRNHSMAFLTAPPYHSSTQLLIVGTDESHCDRNMNSTLSNNNHKSAIGSSTDNGDCNKVSGLTAGDEFGFDIHSVMTMEILERSKGKRINGLVETRNDEVLRRVAEMQRMVDNSEKYLNEQGELVHEFEMKPNIKLPWKDTSVEMDSDNESISSSKVSSNEDTPAPGVLKHSDSLVLLAESINIELNGLTKGLSLVGTDDTEKQTTLNESVINKKTTENTTSKAHRRIQGLTQLLSDLHAFSNDLSQSESDSESVCTPRGSPIHRIQEERNFNQKGFRSSFGLHSPDNTVLAPETNDTNLRDYLQQLKEASNKVDSLGIDLAAKKLTELYGFDIGHDTFIYTDSDVIDLTALPPPRTPDELDALTVINAAPSDFSDVAKSNFHSAAAAGDFESFLAKVTVVPPTQKITPAKELTPEEIMSYIIPPPPPPGLDNNETIVDIDGTDTNKTEALCFIETEIPNVPPQITSESLYMNATNFPNKASKCSYSSNVIEYATVDCKGSFSCCAKSKKSKSEADGVLSKEQHFNGQVPLPPRQYKIIGSHSPPERPPKSIHHQVKTKTAIQSTPSTISTFKMIGGDSGNHCTINPPKLPPRIDSNNHISSSAVLPPRKPINLPAKLMLRPAKEEPNYNLITRLDTPLRYNHFKNTVVALKSSELQCTNSNGTPPPIPPERAKNGHYRSFSDCPSAPPTLSRTGLAIESVQSVQPSYVSSSNGSSNLSDSSQNCQTMNAGTLLTKTSVAMTGLLIRLDQIAVQCTSAQTAGGGVLIDEKLFQRARSELTDQALHLVTASKFLVMAMSNPTATSLPEHLTSCLAALRRITELAQDMTNHTTAPLQTRNIVLKIHDVASSFREMAGVQKGPGGAGPLALQAECLANVLATLLRSLRVFSP